MLPLTPSFTPLALYCMAAKVVIRNELPFTPSTFILDATRDAHHVTLHWRQGLTVKAIETIFCAGTAVTVSRIVEFETPSYHSKTTGRRPKPFGDSLLKNKYLFP